MNLSKNSLENMWVKGENAGNQHFLPYPQCFVMFSTQLKKKLHHLVLNEIVIYKCFQFVQGLQFVFSFTLYQMTKF